MCKLEEAAREVIKELGIAYPSTYTPEMLRVFEAGYKHGLKRAWRLVRRIRKGHPGMQEVDYKLREMINK